MSEAYASLAAGMADDTFYGGAGDDKLFGGDGNDLLLGHDGADSLYGGAGNDTLDGGPGADQMQGGTGDDVYVVDSPQDQPFEKAGEGTDTVQTSLSAYTLGKNLENLVHTGAAAFAGTGNALANVITGSDGNDTLDGGAGADTLYGGAGYDTFIVDNGGDRVFGGSGGADRVIVLNSDFHLNDNSGVEIMVAGGTQGIALYGSAGNEHLIGNAAANVIYGGGGKDALDGMGGDDTLHVTLANRDEVTVDGGAGSDVLVLSTLDTSVPQILVVDGATASGYSGGMGDGYNGVGFTNVDRFQVSAGDLNDSLDFTPVATRVVADGGAGDDRILGGSAGDSLTGGAGNDTLDGRGGADTLVGGDGNDVFYVDNVNDRVVEQAGAAAGHDQVVTTLSSYATPQNVEGLFYDGAGAFFGAANALGNTLDAHLATSATLQGGAGDDTLIAGSGNDILDGGAGRNVLTGGAGADAFRFDAPRLGPDVVTDFQTGVDHVALSKSGFAIAGVAGFDIVDASTGPTEGKATLVVDTVNHTLSWDPDGTGSAAATLFAHGDFTTSAADYTVF